MQSRLAVLQSALGQLGWQVEGFLNPKDALESIKEESYEAVFCDEQLRGATPMGLIAWVKRLSPELPFYLFSNDQDRTRFRRSGEPEALFHFPPVLGQLPGPSGNDTFSTLGDLEAPLSGNTSLMPLPDLIEMMSMGRQKGVIELELGKVGLIVINKDKVEHAASFGPAGTKNGLQALSDLIALPESDYRVLAYEPPGRSTINLTTVTALTEAARLADEQGRYELLLEAISERCPALNSSAIGQATATRPALGTGNAGRLFSAAKHLLEAGREMSGGQARELLFASDEEVTVIVVFGDTLLAAQGPSSLKAKLYRAVHECVKNASS